MTATIIQESVLGEDITVSGVGPDDNGKWAYWISFWKDKQPHICPLVSSSYYYDTEEEANKAGHLFVEEIKGLSLYDTRMPTQEEWAMRIMSQGRPVLDIPSPDTETDAR